ncbi:hypothetical protein SDC9_164006 [bioreactor metagenome]|uniref:Uncharacterized protein n=1 Tax=bioreactor metagenome TaxID=1076179 RepID=A0A645FQG3_9ZZZZ
MYLIPRLNVAAAKPPISVIIPPPRLISNECRVAPFPVRCFQMCDRFPSVLFVSFAGITTRPASFIAAMGTSIGRQSLAVCSSVSTKSLSYFISDRIFSISVIRSVLLIIRCIVSLMFGVQFVILIALYSSSWMRSLIFNVDNRLGERSGNTLFDKNM